jgi:hypothetical protein
VPDLPRRARLALPHLVSAEDQVAEQVARLAWVARETMPNV